MTLRTRTSTVLLMIVATLPVAWAAHAQTLGPQKPSQVVDVALEIGAADCTNVGKKFDTLLRPNGSQTAFAIPQGQVLLVTAIELLGFGANPGAQVQTRIFRGVGQTVNLVAIRESVADPSGRIFQIYEFSPGMVVASGGEICTNNNVNITVSGRLRGYLTKSE